MKTKSTLVCFILVMSVFLNFNKLNAQAVNVKDSLALVDLYNSTNGPGWYNNTNWLKCPVKTWHGVSMEGRKVVHLFLQSNNLTGILPPSIGNLINLTSIDLMFNKITGNIPSTIGNLVNLTSLAFNFNQFTGNIPSTFGSLVNLGVLDLSGNQFSGNIPSELGKLPKLGILYLEDNQLTGSIPNELGNLSELVFLYLNNNKLTGEITPSLGKLLKLTDLNLSYNDLGGTIPAELGNLSNLNALYLNSNKLKGQIPATIGPLPKLVFLSLSENKLNKNVESINNPYLQYLWLDNNYFTFDGIEEMSQKFPFAEYYQQHRIPIRFENNSLSVSAGGTLSNNTYIWYRLGQPGRVIIQGDSVFHPAQTGTYYVKIINSIATGLVLKSDTINYTAPMLSSNSNDALQVKGKKHQFSIYPNPAKDILHVQTNSAASFSLIDQAGRILLTKNIDGSGIISVSQITPGIYYLKNNYSKEVKKVLIEK